MLNPTDLTQPAGDLDDELFPGDDDAAFDDRLQGYLDQAYAKADVQSASDSDEAARQWSYYRAYTAVALRLEASPSTVDVDGAVSTQYGPDQAAAFRRRADAALDAYATAVASPSASNPRGARPSSRSTSTRFAW